MGGTTRILRTVLLMGGALTASAVGVSLAGAQESDVVNAEAPVAAPSAAEPQVNFNDPDGPLPQTALDLSVRDDSAARFSPLTNADPSDREGPRRIELELAAGGGESPLDISIAQRASLGANTNGDLDRRGRGSELRVGQGLVESRREGGRRNSTYVFVASDDEALTWQPGARNEFGGSGSSFALQDQVEVGDLAAGVTWEREGVQTSLAYVEREESTRVGNQTFSQDQSFAGVTVTMRR